MTSKNIKKKRRRKKKIVKKLYRNKLLNMCQLIEMSVNAIEIKIFIRVYLFIFLPGTFDIPLVGDLFFFRLMTEYDPINVIILKKL